MKTKQMKVVDNKLYMSSWSLEKLGKKYGTPLYVYDEEGIRERIKTYINSFKSDKYNTHVVYATKAFLLRQNTSQRRTVRSVHQYLTVVHL